MKSSTPFFKLSALAVAVVTTLTLVACGGGGSSSSASSGGTAGASSYSGTVSGLGSIVVNGVRFSVSGASTADEDNPDQPYTKAFALGSTVTVTGTVNSDGVTGTATSVVVHGGVRGPATNVNTSSGTFSVAGQNIQIDSNTVFDGSLNGFGMATLAAGTTFVEVYGVYDGATQTVLASRVEQISSSAMSALGYAVKGPVTGLDTTNHTFTLQLSSSVTAQVSYTDSNVKPAGATLANGVEVRVLLSQADATALSTATGPVPVTANKVLVKRERQSDGGVTKLQGAVTVVTAGTTWKIGDVTVDISQSPTVDDNLTLSSVASGTIVRVAGTFSNGVLVARKIEANDHDRRHDGGGVKLFGAVSSASGSTFVVQGVTVTLGASGSAAILPTVGSYVEVVAQNTSGVLTAVAINSPRGGDAASRSFEQFGTAACTNGQADLSGSFNLRLRDGQLAVDGSSASFDIGTGVDMSTSTTAETCLIEVKGTMTTVNNANVLKATNIEVVSRTVTPS